MTYVAYYRFVPEALLWTLPAEKQLSHKIQNADEKYGALSFPYFMINVYYRQQEKAHHRFFIFQTGYSLNRNLSQNLYSSSMQIINSEIAEALHLRNGLYRIRHLWININKPPIFLAVRVRWIKRMNAFERTRGCCEFADCGRYVRQRSHTEFSSRR